MQSYLSDQHCDITFVSDQNKNDDHIDRAIRNLRQLQRENELIRKEMEFIRSNPKVYIKPIRDQLSNKINQLRDQNDSLKRMIEKTKIPAYSQMTKKKIVNTECNEERSYRQSMRSSYQHRPLDEVDNNFDKNDATSTCLNYNNGSTLTENHEYVVGPNDQQERNVLISEIRLLLQKAEVFQEQLEKVSKKEKESLKTTTNRQQSQLMKIYQYKKKLVKFLAKLRNRETTMNELVRTYRTMHQETFEKLKEATQALQSLRQAKISQDVDEKYAEVIELEQQLQTINSQLQEMDQTKWLQEIARQLSAAVRRMGFQVPKLESTRQLIDQLCSILIECHITTRKDGLTKLNMLKQYHEEEKKNNSKYILSLKAKEQTLGRKLIDIQMEK